MIERISSHVSKSDRRYPFPRHQIMIVFVYVQEYRGSRSEPNNPATAIFRVWLNYSSTHLAEILQRHSCGHRPAQEYQFSGPFADQLYSEKGI
jgi:hypothetical protein